jgi:hypothetical protein
MEGNPAFLNVLNFAAKNTNSSPFMGHRFHERILTFALARNESESQKYPGCSGMPLSRKILGFFQNRRKGGNG